MSDETGFWIAWWLMVVMTPANIALAFLWQRTRAEVVKSCRYVRKANRDFAEAAALMKYGAIDEAIELLSKYDHEDA